MPKLKTVKSAKDRIKVTGTGKLRSYRRTGRRHLLAGKSAKRMRQLRGDKAISPGEARQIRALIPYV